MEPLTWYWPAEHAAQLSMPVDPWYVPAAHPAHANVVPAAEYIPAAQATHTEGSDAPSAPRK
jgi:hypothetical protein